MAELIRNYGGTPTGEVDAVLVSNATLIDNVFHVASEIGAADALREALRKRTVPPSCWSASGARK